jgi:hypothetical protein
MVVAWGNSVLRPLMLRGVIDAIPDGTWYGNYGYRSVWYAGTSGYGLVGCKVPVTANILPK